MKHRYRIPAMLLALLLVCLPLTACSGGASDEFLSEITLGGGGTGSYWTRSFTTW